MLDPDIVDMGSRLEQLVLEFEGLRTAELLQLSEAGAFIAVVLGQSSVLLLEVLDRKFQVLPHVQRRQLLALDASV
jgi:hypothetical protein